MILEAYSIDYQTGKSVFESARRLEEFDQAANRIAPICDEVMFTAVVPVRTIVPTPYHVFFANGSRRARYIIEVKPIGPDRRPALTSYYISSRWRVGSNELTL